MRSFTTSVAVIHPTASQLLCVRHPSLGVWMFPGGGVESDEAPHVAAKREIFEEVGLDIKLVDFSYLPRWAQGGNSRLCQPIAMIEERLPEGTVPSHFYIDLVYVGLASTANITFREEVCEAGWFGQQSLSNLQTSFPIQELAARVFRQLDDFRRQANA